MSEATRRRPAIGDSIEVAYFEHAWDPNTYRRMRVIDLARYTNMNIVLFGYLDDGRIWGVQMRALGHAWWWLGVEDAERMIGLDQGDA